MKKQLTAGRIICYLFCLSLICTAVFGVSYARYVTSVNGTAIASVASAEMSAGITGTDKSIDVRGLQPGESKTISFEVVNYSGEKASQVAQEYDITVKTAGNLPFKFELQPGMASSGMAGALEETAGSAGVWQTVSSGFLPAGEKARHSYTLTVSWPSGQGKPDYADEIDMVTLIVDAKQAVPAAS